MVVYTSNKCYNNYNIIGYEIVRCLSIYMEVVFEDVYKREGLCW